MKVVDRKKIEIMTIQFKVPKMACSACGETITKAVKEVDPSATVQTDPKTKQVEIETLASKSAIAQAITAAGYPVSDR
ncbi:MAG: heavy-metal-associated domain-containing protein [Hydrococcus sp. Prado102]|jgi:copper chaperone|nr:heavy-metal-associated domain-containing protein [Hydrococcus sp. Prado102]